MMKSSIYIVLLIGVFLANGQSFFDRADDFFRSYVKAGKVDYAAIQKNPEGLKLLTDEIATTDLSNRRVTPAFLKAFYINAYNLLVIEQVVERYPIEGPLKVQGFFDGITHRVMRESLTLNQLEKKVLFSQFPDPRLHFVLVCAAKGCPPLANFSYEPESLEDQLEKRTTEVLNLEWFIRVNNEQVKISQLFDWYRGDFLKVNESLIGYINQYRMVKIANNKPVNYYEYDWSLNELN